MTRDERDRKREQPETEHVREHDPVGVAHRNRQQEEALAGDEEAERREQRATSTHDRRRPAHAFMPAIVDEHAEREQERDDRHGLTQRRGRGEDGEDEAEGERTPTGTERFTDSDESGGDRARRASLGIPAGVKGVIEDHAADVSQRDAEQEQQQAAPAERIRRLAGVFGTRRMEAQALGEQPAGNHVAPDRRQVRATGEDQPAAQLRTHLRGASRRAARARRASSDTPRRSCRRRPPRGLRAAGPPRYTSRSRVRDRRPAPWR